MSASRLRLQPPAAASEEASLAPWAPSQSLRELKEAMSSPGVVQAEVDALLAAIVRPPADDETPRARADFLQSLVELPEEARDRTGSDGRTVRAAAVEALLELGYPYALEVHPDVLQAVRLEAVRRKKGAPPQGVSGTEGVITLMAGAVQLGMLALFVSPRQSHASSDALMLLPMGLVVLPPLSALFGGLLESRRLQSLGALGMALQGLVWLLVALMKSSAPSSAGRLFLLFIPWYLPLVAAYLMRPKSEPEDPAASKSPGAPS